MAADDIVSDDRPHAPRWHIDPRPPGRIAERILLVDPDAHSGETLRQALTREGYRVEWVTAGAAAIASAAAWPPELVLLDVTLADIDGLWVCRRLRAALDDVAIMIVTGRGQEIDVVIGLDSGADDYVVKPFALAELLARVRAHLRRPTRAAQPKVAELGNLTVNVAARRAVVAGRGELLVTAKEFDLLAMFMVHRGRALTSQWISEEIWGWRSDATTKSLAVHIANLRRKMADGGASPMITTIRGSGYRMDPA